MRGRQPLILNLIAASLTAPGGLQRTALDVARVLTDAGAFVLTHDTACHRKPLRPVVLERLFGHLMAWREIPDLDGMGWEGERGPDLVIAHNGAASGIGAALEREARERGHRAGAPVLRMWQNELGDYAERAWPRWHPNHHKLKWIDTGAERRAARDCTNMAVSERMAGDLTLHARIPVKGVIENAVDTEHFRPPDAELGPEPRGAVAAEVTRAAHTRHMTGDAFRAAHGLPARPARLLLFAGRPVAYKGLALMAEWARQFQGRDLHVVLAGVDRAPAEFNGLANVHAIGNIPYGSLPEMYAAADFFALPSLHEGCSYAVMEAMACGVPPLLTDAGHVATVARRDPELARWIAPVANPERLTAHLAHWIESPAVAEALRWRVRQYALEFHSMDRFAREWIAAAETALGRRFT